MPENSNGSYPIPAPSPTGQTLPDLGTLKTGSYTVTLNSLRRVGPQLGILTATVYQLEGVLDFDGLQEPGYDYLKNVEKRFETDGTVDSTGEFSAVTLTAPGSSRIYLPVRDENDRCLCTSYLDVENKIPTGVFVYMTLPEQASAVDITINGVGQFTDVKIAL
ncbi:MAG: hypothetical protein ACRCTR_07330 [Actinomycetota bacterium]